MLNSEDTIIKFCNDLRSLKHCEYFDGYFFYDSNYNKNNKRKEK